MDAHHIGFFHELVLWLIALYVVVILTSWLFFRGAHEPSDDDRNEDQDVHEPGHWTDAP